MAYQNPPPFATPLPRLGWLKRPEGLQNAVEEQRRRFAESLPSWLGHPQINRYRNFRGGRYGDGGEGYRVVPGYPTGRPGVPDAKTAAGLALGAAAIYGLTQLLKKKKNGESREKPARNGGRRESRKPIHKTAPYRGAYKKGGVVKKRRGKKAGKR